MTRAGLPLQPGQRVDLTIRDLRIVGPSRIEARRLAEAMPAALAAAIAGQAAATRRSDADRVAGEVVAAVLRVREGKP